MVASYPLGNRISYGEYLELERRTGLRHEWWAGLVRAMAGGTPAHSLAKANLLRAVGNALEGKTCLALDSDQKVVIAELDLDVYPDLSVVCGPLERATRDRNALTNPTLVAEVLSASTEGHDLGPKRRAYQRIPSLQQIVFVWPEARAVEVHTRGTDGEWVVRDAPDEAIRLGSIDVTLSRSALFARLEEVEEESPIER